MGKVNKCVLSIAGFDPSGGAGILADIKTFEAHKVKGMGVMTALTFQNDIEFSNVHWISSVDIIQQFAVLRRRFDFPVVKIGMIAHLDTLEEIIAYCKTYKCKIIWDPIIRVSAGFEVHQSFDRHRLKEILKEVFLITPNTHEVKNLIGISNEMEAARELSQYCHVLLKGGHSESELGTDYLFSSNKVEKIDPIGFEAHPKHGSGCVLSAAIAANLSNGENLIAACRRAKAYAEQFLSSNTTLLGIHHVQ